MVDKIVRKEVFPHIQTNRAKLLMSMPVISKRIKEKVREFVLRKFGEHPYEVVVGGAPLNKEIENFFISIGFPIAMGYGTTETAPLITFAHQDNYVAGSCGVAVKHMEVKVLSDDPENVAGELVCRGINVMKGYYKNQEATDAVLDEDGLFNFISGYSINSATLLSIKHFKRLSNKKFLRILPCQNFHLS